MIVIVKVIKITFGYELCFLFQKFEATVRIADLQTNNDVFLLHETTFDDSVTLRLNRTDADGVSRQDVCAYSNSSGFGHKISGKACAVKATDELAS